MKFIVRHLPFPFLFLLLANSVLGQQNVLEALNNAEKLYENGHPTEALNILRENNSILADKTVRWRGFKLATLCYLTLNDADSARLMAKRLMSLNPTFIPNSATDPYDFQEIMKGFEPYTSIRFGILGAGALSFYATSVLRNPGSFEKNYGSAASIGIGLSAEFRIRNNWWLSTNLINLPIRQRIEYAAADWQVKIDEDISALHWPVLLNYQKETKKLGYAFGAGPYLSFIGRSSYNASFTSSIATENIVNQQINSSDEKASVLYGYAFMGRVWRPALKGFWFIQAQFTGALNSVNQFDYETLNRQMLSEFYFLPDDVLPMQLSLQVGYLFSLSYKVNDLQKVRK